MGKIRQSIGIALIQASNFFYKLCRFLCVCILKPTDLAASTKRCYSLASHLKGCAEKGYADAGLDDTEEYFAAKYLKKNSGILVIGCGGGRESIALAKRGFQVTGIDFVQDCVKMAAENAAKMNLQITFLQQDITALALPKENRFEAIMFSALLYSLLPSKKKRIAILKKVSSYASPNAVILLNFLSQRVFDARKEKVKKCIALAMLNPDYEPGDYLEGDGEFKHYFTASELKEELQLAGFILVDSNFLDPHNSFAIASIV